MLPEMKQSPKPGCRFLMLLSAAWLAVVGLAGYFLIVGLS